MPYLYRCFSHADVHALANQVIGNRILVPAIRNKIVVGDLGNRPDGRFKRTDRQRQLLVPTRFCGRMRRKSAWCGQNGPDETACFDPEGAQTAFGTQNSKVCSPLADSSAAIGVTAGFSRGMHPVFIRLSCIEILHFSEWLARRCWTIK